MSPARDSSGRFVSGGGSSGGSAIAQAFVDIRPNTKGFTREAESNILGPLKGLAAKAAGIFAGVKVVDFLSGAVAEAREAEKVQRLTESAIKATGGAAKVTAGDVETLSGRLSNMAAVDDELIQQGANLLLTFRNVRNEVGEGNNVFDRATEAALNLSAAGFGSMESASVLMGKALNDPIAGLTALGRSGVTFTKQQKEQIKAMVEAGNVLGAQKIILAEVNAQVGGAAASQADAGARLQVVFGNLKEEVGARLLPVLDTAATFLADRLPGALDALGRFFGPIIDQVTLFWNALRTGFTEDEGLPIERYALILRENLLPIIKAVADFIENNWKPILIGLAALFAPGATLVAGVIFAYTHFQTFRDVIDAVARFVTDVVAPAIVAFARGVQETFAELAGWTREHWAEIEEAIGHVLAAIEAAVDAGVAAVKAVWRAVGDEILGYTRTVWGAIKGVIDGAVKAIQGVIEFALAVINGDWGKAWEALKKVLAGIWDAIVALVRGGIEGARLVLKAGLDLIELAWNTTWNAIKGAFGAVWDAIKNTARAALDWIVDKVEAVARPIQNLLSLLGQAEAKGSKLGGVNVGGIAQSLGGFFGAPGDPSQAAGLISAVESRDELRRRLAAAVTPEEIADLHRQLISAQERVEEAAESVFTVGSKTVQNFQELARRAGLSDGEIQAITAPITATLEQEAARALDAVFEQANVAFQFGAESGAARRARLIAELLAGRSLADIAQGVAFQASQERKGDQGVFQAAEVHLVVDLNNNGQTQRVFEGMAPSGQKVRALVRGA